jgi:hypothetical protein
VVDRVEALASEPDISEPFAPRVSRLDWPASSFTQQKLWLDWFELVKDKQRFVFVNVRSGRNDRFDLGLGTGDSRSHQSIPQTDSSDCPLT